MHPLVEEIKKDMDSFERNKEEYVKKDNYISDLLELKGKKRLLVNYPSTYFVGNYKDTSNHKYVLVGLNPGYDENQLLVHIEIGRPKKFLITADRLFQDIS